jgi:hypothetical protein
VGRPYWLTSLRSGTAFSDGSCPAAGSLRREDAVFSQRQLSGPSLGVAIPDQWVFTPAGFSRLRTTQFLVRETRVLAVAWPQSILSSVWASPSPTAFLLPCSTAHGRGSCREAAEGELPRASRITSAPINSTRSKACRKVAHRRIHLGTPPNLARNVRALRCINNVESNVPAFANALHTGAKSVMVGFRCLTGRALAVSPPIGAVLGRCSADGRNVAG